MYLQAGVGSEMAVGLVEAMEVAAVTEAAEGS